MSNYSSAIVSRFVPAIVLLSLSCVAAAENGTPDSESAAAPASSDREYSVGETIIESNVGDVYSEPSKWQELSYGDIFTKGWNKPWASPPTGGGGAPRQGWLNAYEGVFYRLGIAVFGLQHDLAGVSDGNTGSLTLFTPLNQRLEVQTDIPMVVSNRRSAGLDKETNFGDFQITPRLMLSESRDVTQTFNITFRTPTGVNGNLGTNVAAVTPNYQFWANWWKGLVVRGGGGFFIPYGGDLQASGARSLFNVNLAVGYYFTPHDFTPLGDMVWYLSTNLSQTLDNRGPNGTVVTLTPGFRTHMGMNWYLLGGV
ncbi:MAG: hypothetical protein H6R26_2641, partial [Proteobacteria bacterium]|nr:hypothetical protein [Pseudomonadota bacterium]